MAHLDPELERFKRTIDLVAYAKKAGYEPWPDAVGSGLTVLDHPGRDRIAVAQTPSGVWIYASVGDYQLRAPHESGAHALARLRGCIQGARDKGTIVEFVQGRDAAARSAEVPLDRVRERLRAFRDDGIPLDLQGPRRSPPPQDHDRTSAGRDAAAAQRKAGPGEAPTRRPQPELNQRRYDWSPPVPNAPRETEVEQRLRRWREAQEALDRRRPEPREAQARQLGLSPAPAAERGLGLGQKKASELNRTYELASTPSGRDGSPRGTRGRSTDRDR